MSSDVEVGTVNLSEWPEIVSISKKLVLGEQLNEIEKQWIVELAEVSGWNYDDVINELKNLDKDPSLRAEKYKESFEKYYREAIELKEKGDNRQAAEKIWGAITTLIKLYAAKQGIPIIHWSIAKLDRFVENNVREEYRRLFRDLLDKGHILHEHFYEGNLSDEGFKSRWEEIVELLKRAKEIVYNEK